MFHARQTVETKQGNAQLILLEMERIMKQERTYPRVEVTRKAENSIKSGHPWIYHTELVEGEAGCNDGALVDIISTPAF